MIYYSLLDGGSAKTLHPSAAATSLAPSVTLQNPVSPTTQRVCSLSTLHLSKLMLHQLNCAFLTMIIILFIRKTQQFIWNSSLQPNLRAHRRTVLIWKLEMRVDPFVVLLIDWHLADVCRSQPWEQGWSLKMPFSHFSFSYIQQGEKCYVSFFLNKDFREYFQMFQMLSPWSIVKLQTGV